MDEGGQKKHVWWEIFIIFFRKQTWEMWRLKQQKCLSLGHQGYISKELFFIHSVRVLIFSILGIWSGDHQARLSELLAPASHILLSFLWSILPEFACKWSGFEFSLSIFLEYLFKHFWKNEYFVYQRGWIETLLIFRCPQCPSTTNNRYLNDRHTHKHTYSPHSQWSVCLASKQPQLTVCQSDWHTNRRTHMHGGFALFSETHSDTLFPVYPTYSSCVCAHKSAAGSASNQSHVFTSVTESRVTVWLRKTE